MSDKIIFLSHIHEESELAQLIKEPLEDEFSGFVDVFVSSDGSSIPAGANFLKRIEDGLADCIGAVYLVSPTSVKRHWISFELGAVWIRNVVAIRNGQPEIPTIPMCHSGITPSALPAPLNNLNAIVANEASQLEASFRSLQRAVGGKGTLKTDFNHLSSKIVKLEREYTLDSNLKYIFSLLTDDPTSIIQHCEQQPKGSRTILNCGRVETSKIQILKAYEANELNGLITVQVTKSGITMGPMGGVNDAEVAIVVPVDLVLEWKDLQ